MEREFKGFVCGRLLTSLAPGLKTAFSSLEYDVIAYNKARHLSRRRAFTAFALEHGRYKRVGTAHPRFNAMRAFHTSYKGDQPAPIADELVEAEFPQEVLAAVAPSLPVPIERYAIGFNMIRVTATDDEMGSPAPGLHQDGYDFSCHLAVSRSNAAGGTSIIATSTIAEDVVLEQTLQERDFVFFNDREMFHTATPVTCRIGGTPAHRDMIIMDFVALS